MTDLGTLGIASELPGHRRCSPIGALQRHFVLDPVLIAVDGPCPGVCAGVVIIEGSRGTYAYGSDVEGEICDFEPVSVAPPGTSTNDMLAVMGYRVGVTDALPLRRLA